VRVVERGEAVAQRLFVVRAAVGPQLRAAAARDADEHRRRRRARVVGALVLVCFLWGRFGVCA
jgi:hypothetical protein